MHTSDIQMALCPAALPFLLSRFVIRNFRAVCSPIPMFSTALPFVLILVSSPGMERIVVFYRESLGDRSSVSRCSGRIDACIPLTEVGGRNDVGEEKKS